MKALEKIITNNKNGRFVCVGLDSDINKIPKILQSDKDAVFKFNSAIIEATKNKPPHSVKVGGSILCNRTSNAIRHVYESRGFCLACPCYGQTTRS